jgi:ADP-ribosylglycohydrolase
MSALDIVACASPIVPAVMLAVTLYGPWYSVAMPPLQFAALVGEAVLATAATHAVAEAIAAAGFAIAIAGLAGIVLRDRWIEHRASKILDWERFEEALASYTGSPQADTHGNDSHPT